MSSISSELPFWHFDNDLMVFNDGSLGGGFKLKGIDISCATSAEINLFSRSIENLLTSSADGLRLQVFYKLTPNVDEMISKHENQITKEIEDYKPIADARVNFLKEQSAKGAYFVPEIYFYVRSKPLKYKRKSLFDKPDKFQQASKQYYLQHKEKFQRSLKQIESSLVSAKLEPINLNNQEWFSAIFEYLNFDRSKNIGTPNLRELKSPFSASLNSQLSLTDFFSNADGVKVGDYTFKVITLKNLPEGQTYASMIENLAKIPFHFWMTQNLSILDQAKERSRLEVQRRIAHSMASGNENVSDLESESKLGHIEELLSEILEGSTKLISTDLNVIIWGTSKEEVEEKCDDVLRAFRGLNQAEGLVETLPVKEAFLNCLPGVCTGLRHHVVKSSNAAHLMPLFASWMGNDNPVCVFPNRDQALFSIDPFAKELPNWNGIVFGGSGSGKSFSVAQLMLGFAGKKERPKIFWIDNGASSKNLVEVLGGEFIDMNLSSGICINMFDLPKGQTAPSSEKVKLILAVLELILKEEDAAALPKRHKSLLEEAIYKTYASIKGKIPVLSDLKKILADHNYPEMQNYADILFSWTGDTAFGKMLDGKTNVSFDKDIISLEVQSLNSSGELKDVILLLLTSYINDMAVSDVSREYLCVVDEAERLFKAELAKEFVITCYRTWRKYKSAIWCLSQNYKDFMQDKNLKDSLMPNATNVIILRQRKIDWKHFQETFDFNDAQVEVIKSLEVAKGRYSEFFFLQDESQAIVRLVPEPLSYWICTSDGNDKTKILKMRDKYPDLKLIEILQKLAFKKEVA